MKYSDGSSVSAKRTRKYLVSDEICEKHLVIFKNHNTTVTLVVAIKMFFGSFHHVVSIIRDIKPVLFYLNGV